MPQFMGLKILRFGVLNADVIVVVAAWQSRVAGTLFADFSICSLGRTGCWGCEMRVDLT